MNAKYVAIVTFPSLLPTGRTEKKKLTVKADSHRAAQAKITEYMRGLCPTGAWRYEVEPVRLGR